MTDNDEKVQEAKRQKNNDERLLGEFIEYHLGSEDIVVLLEPESDGRIVYRVILEKKFSNRPAALLYGLKLSKRLKIKVGPWFGDPPT